MTAVIVTAVGFALGVVGMVSALHPAPPSLRAALADLERDPSRIGSRMGLTDRSSKIRPDLYLAGYLGAFVSEQDYARARLWPLFAITGTSIQELCGEIVLAASVGLLLPIAWWALVGMSIAAMGFYGSKGPFFAMPPMFLSGAALAAGIAWINSIGNLGGFFGPWYVGVMKDLTGSYAGGLYGLALLGLIAAIVCALFLHIPGRTPSSALPVGAPAG